MCKAKQTGERRERATHSAANRTYETESQHVLRWWCAQNERRVGRGSLTVNLLAAQVTGAASIDAGCAAPTTSAGAAASVSAKSSSAEAAATTRDRGGRGDDAEAEAAAATGESSAVMGEEEGRRRI